LLNIALNGHQKPSLEVAEISTATTRPCVLINAIVNMKQIFPNLHVTRERSECNDLSFMITTVTLLQTIVFFLSLSLSLSIFTETRVTDVIFLCHIIQTYIRRPKKKLYTYKLRNRCKKCASLSRYKIFQREKFNCVSKFNTVRCQIFIKN